jgi:hypothetical protein
MQDWMARAVRTWAADGPGRREVSLSSVRRWVNRSLLPDDRTRQMAAQLRQAALAAIGHHRPDSYLSLALMSLATISEAPSSKGAGPAVQRRRDLKDRMKRGRPGGPKMFYGFVLALLAALTPGTAFADVNLLVTSAASDRPAVVAGRDGAGPRPHAILPFAGAERRAAESLVDFATAFAEGRAAGRPLNALQAPVLDFDARFAGERAGALTAPSEMPTLNLERLSAAVDAVMAERGGHGALADPAVTRAAIRLFWMMGLKPSGAIPDGDLLFPDLTALQRSLAGAPVERNPVLYVLASPADASAVEALSTRLGRPIRAVVGDHGFAARGRLDFRAVDAALTAQLQPAELDKLRFVLEGADIDTLMALLAHLPDGSALRRVRYLALETILSLAVPFTAANLIEMNAVAETVAERQA